jgi:hypothetical protein
LPSKSSIKSPCKAIPDKLRAAPAMRSAAGVYHNPLVGGSNPPVATRVPKNFRLWFVRVKRMPRRRDVAELRDLLHLLRFLHRLLREFLG